MRAPGRSVDLPLEEVAGHGASGVTLGDHTAQPPWKTLLRTSLLGVSRRLIHRLWTDRFMSCG
jgi:hypothetical protein